MLSVSRWYYRDSPAEMYRTLALAVEALRRTGVTNPRAHLAIVRNMTFAHHAAETPDGVGTLLVSASPFTDAALATLDRLAPGRTFWRGVTPRDTRDRLPQYLTG